MENNLPTIKEKFESIAAKKLDNADFSTQGTVECTFVNDLKKNLLENIKLYSQTPSEKGLEALSRLVDFLDEKVFQEGAMAEKYFKEACDKITEEPVEEEFEFTPEELKFVEGKADL